MIPHIPLLCQNSLGVYSPRARSLKRLQGPSGYYYGPGETFGLGEIEYRTVAVWTSPLTPFGYGI